MIEAKEIQANIDNPPCSDVVHRAAFGKMVFTGGIRQLAEDAGAYWLIDAIASYQTSKLDAQCGGFQLWTLTKTGTGAVLECRRDTDDPAIVRQEIEYTDFPLSSLSLYVEGEGANRVLLLPSEH